jgi:hypothetical protein
MLSGRWAIDDLTQSRGALHHSIELFADNLHIPVILTEAHSTQSPLVLTMSTVYRKNPNGLAVLDPDPEMFEKVDRVTLGLSIVPPWLDQELSPFFWGFRASGKPF